MKINYTLLNEEELDYVEVGEANELGNGERMFISIDEKNIVVFNIAGRYFAIADLCSHDEGPVGEGEIANEFEIACPRHGARFDLRNGKVLSLPAIVDIPAYPVRVTEGRLEIGLPLN
ncbi:MAG: non-heme iron oxygenase ferredoxin subunit [Anaerolineae bacterium]|nr:MAG: non-heme iron oxygenase ferredoxin subunit [Anaerolineae bacterium]